MPETPADFLRRLINNLPAIKRDILQKIVAVEAERQWADNFRKEGFTDRSLTKWPARKKQESPQRALLVKTSTLKGHALKGRVSGDSVDFVFPLEYERVHNEGLRAGRGGGFQMPKRQFIGESYVLNQRIQKKVTAYLKTFLNQP